MDDILRISTWLGGRRVGYETNCGRREETVFLK